MAELLRVRGLRAGYGEAVVVQGVDLSLDQGQSLALLGRNGTGKTTLINTLVGVTRRHAGTIALAGRDITALPAHRRAAAGIGWVPQERNIFKSLSVDENLSAVARPGPWTAQRAYEMFPRLAERRANLGHQLSGGEQQMLAVARALVLNPKLLLLDEPLEGLAPILVEELLRSIARVVRDEGVSAIIVEQNPRHDPADHAPGRGAGPWPGRAPGRERGAAGRPGAARTLAGRFGRCGRLDGSCRSLWAAGHGTHAQGNREFYTAAKGAPGAFMATFALPVRVGNGSPGLAMPKTGPRRFRSPMESRRSAPGRERALHERRQCIECGR